MNKFRDLKKGPKLSEIQRDPTPNPEPSPFLGGVFDIVSRWQSGFCLGWDRIPFFATKPRGGWARPLRIYFTDPQAHGWPSCLFIYLGTMQRHSDIKIIAQAHTHTHSHVVQSMIGSRNPLIARSLIECPTHLHTVVAVGKPHPASFCAHPDRSTLAVHICTAQNILLRI